ncbi:hypothetical protein BDA99DRAFT_563545 [Phascolomyces articulosus]|uniref:Galactose oxidase n=1 Tax=Phascolomyces articulosus TaxID=60185 RepID=A0AAD5JSS3_9FUNG|nr:hypothetical protein BDA99DRAFT_563545 [Phascolomyces articulosus]
MPTEAKMYCYGGQGYDNNTVTAVVDQFFFSLDLSQDRTVASLQSAWEGVNKDVGPNYYFGMAALPNQGLIFIDGGTGAGDNGVTQARYDSATFDTSPGGEWAAVTPARAGGKLRTHTATLGQDNNTIYIWGGYRDINTGKLASEPESSLEMFIFNIKEAQWSTGNAASTSYRYQAAVLVGSSIYYIGGAYVLPLGGSDSVAMNSIRIYDTGSGQWSDRSTSGLTPTTRIRHTATLKPSSNEIILFGGQNRTDSNDIRSDYFYVLNTETFFWSTPTISEDGGSFAPTGIRGHAAVLVKDNLYIMFGGTLEATVFNIVNQIWVLDVNRWAWVSSVSAVAAEPLPAGSDPSLTAIGPTPTGGSPDSASDGVSSGTIAGAVVGSVVGVALIAGAAFFFIRRNRRQPEQQEQQQQQQLQPDTKGYNNNTGGQYGMYPVVDTHPPPPNYGELEHNNSSSNIRQPLSPSTNYSSQANTREIESFSVGYTETSTSQGQSSASAFHGSEKPDGSVQHFVLAPVKPDGA